VGAPHATRRTGPLTAHVCVGVVRVATFPFYVSTWEEYHTGVLYLGVMNGPTEGLLAAQLCMLLSAWLGTGGCVCLMLDATPCPARVCGAHA
jgi:hypothetical protein